ARPVVRSRPLARLLVADALKHRVRAEAAGQLADAFDGLVAAFADDVGCAEVAAEGGPVGVAAEQDDLLGAEPLRCDHAAEADRPVADDRNTVAWLDPRTERRVLSRAAH